MSRLLTLTGALEHDPAIDAWFAAPQDALRGFARPWFEQMRQCGGDVRELIHDGCPVACVKDAPFGYVNAFTAHVNVGFYYGAALDDPARLLEGGGKRMRHVKLRWAQDVNPAALSALIAAAYRDIRLRLDSST